MEYIIFEEKGTAGQAKGPGDIIGSGFLSLNAAWMALFKELSKRLIEEEVNSTFLVVEANPAEVKVVISLWFNSKGITANDINIAFSKMFTFK